MTTLTSWPILSFIPTEISGTVKKAFVFGGAGNEALIVLANGDIYALGFNGNGCLGVSDGCSTLEPKRIEPLCQKDITGLAYGMGPHVLAVTHSGELYSWGHGGYGQLGHNEPEKNKPMLIQMSGKIVTSIACGSYHSVALTSDGDIYTWGSNNCGQLGLGITNNQPNPKRVCGILSSGNKSTISISCGQSFTLALTSDGELYAWGYNGNGQLGIGNNTNQQLPAKVNGMNGNFVEKIVCGMAHVLALTYSGELYSWGANSYGQLGLGTTLNTPLPTLITSIEEGWSDIAAHHYNHISAGVTVSGKICMWGQCHGLTLLEPREVSVTSLDDVFACFGMPQIMFRLTEMDTDESESLKDVVGRSFNDPTTSDFTFIVNGKTIYVHKAILKIRCIYFKNMFSSNWEESSKNEIEVTLFSYNVYETFLKYLYTDQIEISPCEAIALLNLADSYCETRLKRLCENVIKKGISIENVATLLAAATKFNAGTLEDFCFRYALNHLTAVTQTDAFKELDGETVKVFMIKAGMNNAFKR